jgi:hypothetical protein
MIRRRFIAFAATALVALVLTGPAAVQDDFIIVQSTA